MLIDSHCHLDRIDLEPYQNDFACFMHEADRQNIEHMLCIAIDLESYPAMFDLVSAYSKISLTVGVHPNVQDGKDPDADELIALGGQDKIIGIGETGLDYFRLKGDLEWQRERFRNHIRAARLCRKPLIIHTREAAQDTIRIMREEGADKAGGVMHCFTESWAVAEAALDLGFYISFSGIVTFKNATALKEVARRVPLERMLIETDSPYLAPVPHRGKTNQPGLVIHVAEEIAKLRGVPFDQVATVTTNNFFNLFNIKEYVSNVKD